MPDSLRTLVSILQSHPEFTQTVRHESSDYELWNWPYVLALIVILLAAEWTLRKLNGML